MSYHRRHRRALSGLSSRAPGIEVSKGALGAYVAPDLISGRSIVPSWYQAMQGVQGTTLGDDTLDAAAVEAKWRADMLAGQQQLIAAQKVWAKGDEFQKWIQIGVTASIPVFGAIWRALGIGRRRKIR